MDPDTKELKKELAELKTHLEHPTGTIYNFHRESPELLDYFSHHAEIVGLYQSQSSDKVRALYDYIHQLVTDNEKINFPAAFVKLLEDYMVGSDTKATEVADFNVNFVAQGNESAAEPVHKS